MQRQIPTLNSKVNMAQVIPLIVIENVAVGLSVTGPIEADVREYIAKLGDIKGLFLLRPENKLGMDSLHTSGDVLALAQQFKVIKEFVRERNATRLLLFYFGPLNVAMWC